MSRGATLSILGLYGYDDSIFDNFIVPDGVDKDTAVSTICLDNAELEILLPDPDTMKQAIKIWSTAMQYKWKTLTKTTMFEYNPIWNKDGTMTETETTKTDSDSTGSTSDNSRVDVAGTTQVAAYNSETYENRDKNSGNTIGINTGSSEGTLDETVTRTYKRVEQGNIGITSTQELIERERVVAAFDIYSVISEDFRRRFCLLVY